MSEIKLYRLLNGQATELEGSASDLERPLQNLIEANLEQMMGIRFEASEYGTGKQFVGHIDTLGPYEGHSRRVRPDASSAPTSAASRC